MRITTKGQITIPQALRLKFGLLPNTTAVFEEADGGVIIRPAKPKYALIEERLREARGIADANLSTDEIMRLTRGEEDGGENDGAG